MVTSVVHGKGGGKRESRLEDDKMVFCAGVATYLLLDVIKRRKRRSRDQKYVLTEVDLKLQLHKARAQGDFRLDWFMGDKLGVSEVADGVYARVYACESRHVKGLIGAAKAVNFSLMETDKDRSGLEVRMEAIQRLRHPHILRLYDALRSETDVVLVQERCDGGELFDRLAEKPLYSEHDAREYIKKMLEGLAYAHANGIIHKNLKHDYIVLKSKDSDMDIKISDWGMAYQLHEAEGAETPCRSLAYMPPEVLEASLQGRPVEYTDKADVWALGIISYMLLSGQHPFGWPEVSMTDLMANIRACKPEFPSRMFQNVTPEAEDVVRSMLAKKPHTRLTARACLEHEWFRRVPSRSSVQLDDDEAEEEEGGIYGGRYRYRASKMTQDLGPHLRKQISDLQEKRKASTLKTAVNAVMGARRLSNALQSYFEHAPENETNIETKHESS